MESNSLTESIFRELIKSVHILYRSAPNTPFKDGPEFYAALRAADKGKALLEGNLEALVLMEQEDAAYWRNRFFRAHSVPDESAVAIDIAPEATASAAVEGGAAAPSRPIYNPEEESDDEESDVSSIGIHSDNGFLTGFPVQVESPPRPRINLLGLTATPNLGPLLPSPMTMNMIYDDI